MRILAVLGVVLMFSGCICCGGKDFSDFMPGEKVASEGNGEDVSPGDGGIEDVAGPENAAPEEAPQADEVTTAQPEEAAGPTTTISSSVQATVTTEPQATATTQASSSIQSKPNSGSYDCVRAAGFDPDKVYYGYSPDCGMKFKSDASMVSIRTGVDIQPFNLAIMSDDPGMRLLECFYGTYSQSNPAFGQCPMLFCPKTGGYQIVSGQVSASVSSQMSGFAKKCV